MPDKWITCLAAGTIVLAVGSFYLGISSIANRRRFTPCCILPTHTVAEETKDREHLASSRMAVFDMSSAGTGVAECYDTLPPIEDMVQDSEAKFHKVAYRMCCGNSSIKCRKASRQLEIPKAGIQALSACSARTVGLKSVDLSNALVMVTGSSSNHYDESLVLLNSIQQHYPNSTILYWDLGLTKVQAMSLRSVCGVSYRHFNFSRYPKHVANLKTCAFKAAIILESLMEHTAVWWLDSSIRFTSSDSNMIYKSVIAMKGLGLFGDAGHTVYAATYPQMYDYIATDKDMLKVTKTSMGGSIIVVNTKEIFSTFLAWFYMCSMDEHCLAPVAIPGNCNFSAPGGFANCHRFDQSLVTILAANIWGFNSQSYRLRHPSFLVDRRKRGRNDLNLCADIH